MTITYVQNARVPSERAHSYQIVQTCAGFVHAGHAVTLLTPARGITENTFTAYGITPNLFTHERLKCLDPLTGRKRFLALAYATQRWFFLRALRRRVRTITSDVWYTRDVALIDGLRLTKGPWVLELHDAPADLRRWERVKPRIAHFVAISEGVAAWLRAQGIVDARITIAHDGFDPSMFTHPPRQAEARKTFGLPEDAFILVYTGSCYPWKGVDLAVTAWGHAPAHAHLVIAGAGEQDLTRLRALPTEPDAKKRIHFLPAMPRPALTTLFAAADAGLLSTSPHYDIGRCFTSPLKLFEYLAAGLPILASDVPSSREVLTPVVARFFAYTEEAFAEAVTALAADTAWRAAAMTQAPQVARPYTWDARAARIAEALKKFV